MSEGEIKYINYCYRSQSILSTVLWDGPRRQRIRLRIVMVKVASDGKLAPLACGSLSSVRVCISGAATVLVRNVSPWDYGMSIWTQRVSPQLAFLHPIPAPVPLCVCINLLQTAGWSGCSESSAALGPGWPCNVTHSGMVEPIPKDATAPPLGS